MISVSRPGHGRGASASPSGRVAYLGARPGDSMLVARALNGMGEVYRAAGISQAAQPFYESRWRWGGSRKMSS